MLNGSTPPFRRNNRPVRSLSAILSTAVIAAGGTAIMASPAAAAVMRTVYVSTTGSGTACSATEPCTIAQAQATVRTIAPTMSGDIVVSLASGTYTLTAPLTFTAADSGANGYTVTWRAGSNSRPIISGGQKVSGWTVADSTQNIWRATVGTGFDSRQLYVDGRVATRARTQVTRSSFTASTTGLSFSGSALSYLNNLANQSRIELESVNSFTDRYVPVQSISNNTITMKQPAWNNNSWGYDTLTQPFRSGPMYLANAREFLDAAGEWYLDTAAGVLYYKPLSGQDMATVDVQLPRLESLVRVGGTYAAPAHHLSFVGLQFSYTSWLQPSGNQGYADQQTGAYMYGTYTRPADALSSCQSGCSLFEATRPTWRQMPAAVQVSAANAITFSDNRYTSLGQIGLGIGNDANAHATGVGLGARDINVVGNIFEQLSAGAIIAGGVQADAHHPSDSRMTNSNIVISNNLIHDVALEYRSHVGILMTYTAGSVIAHNELYNLPYSGIATGYGWGANDAGGSQDYIDRGLYNYQPRYTTATIMANNQVLANYVHDVVQQMTDAGAFYHLSASPGSTVNQNYFRNSNGWLGLYFDEGARYVSATNNVFDNTGTWAYGQMWANNNTGNLTLTNNWTTNNGSNIASGARSNSNTGTVVVSGGNWPSGAQAVMAAAGLEAAYQYLKTGSNVGLYSSFASGSQATLGSNNGQFSVRVAGADMWGAGGQRDDAYGAIYQTQSAASGTTVTARIDQQENTNAWAKAGVVIRNNLAAPGSSTGYAVMVRTPGNGVSFQWDSDNDGYLDQNTTTASGAGLPLWVRLVRSGTQVTGYYSTNGTTFTQVGSATLSTAGTTQDAGVIATSHNASVAGTAVFSNLRITTAPVTSFANIDANVVAHHGNQFTISGAGADVWGAGGQRDDQYAAAYRPASLASGGTVTVRVDSQANTNAWAKAGIMLRNSIPGAGVATGYCVVAVTPGNGVTLQWDSDGDGYLDQSAASGAGTTAPVWLRLARNGSQVTASWSVNGTTWTTVSTITLTSANTTLDAGVFALSHASVPGTTTFSEFSIA